MLSDIKTEENPIDNQDSYASLVAIIEAGQGMMLLIIASCEPGEFQNELIRRYETELAPAIPSYQIILDRSEPSLRAALEELVNNQPELRKTNASAVISVQGAADLMSIPIRENEENSALDRFFGYLQWTREGLREFQYPIVLWVTPKIMTQLMIKAPDFWRWRGGVFRFKAPVKNTKDVAVDDSIYLPSFAINRTTDLPLDELLAKIDELEKQNKPSLALATTLDRAGQAYSSPIVENKEKAIEYFNQAVAIQEKLGLSKSYSDTLIRLGNLHINIGNYSAAADKYQQCLDINTQLGDYDGIAMTLSLLGFVCCNQENWNEAEQLYRRALEFFTELGDFIGISNIWMSLGNIACYQGDLDKAIQLYQKSLKTFTELNDSIGIANAWRYLGNISRYRGHLEEAEQLYIQSINTFERVGEDLGAAKTNWNLAKVYRSKPDHQKAQEHYDIAHQLFTELGAKKDLEKIETNWNSALK
jgi:tetratricopeptide (TPR) repeat protein